MYVIFITHRDGYYKCYRYWVEDREIWVVFLAWATDSSSPDSSNRLWKRPPLIQWYLGPGLGIKGLITETYRTQTTMYFWC
jgi:hypothetical protein